MFPEPQAGVSDLMKKRKAIYASERCEDVINMIRKDASLEYMAVIDKAGAPIGSIERHSLLATVSHPLHYAVFQNKPITELQTSSFIKVEASASFDRLSSYLAEMGVSLNQGGVIVVDDDKYVGVLDNADLLNQMMHLNATRSKELSAAHETVMDSVNYASRIQQGLLPTVDRFRSLVKGVGLVWEPRDVVGGDIYWLSPVHESGCFWIAMIDCTGHGVPGAMVSMLVASALDRIFETSPELAPGNVLAKLGDLVRRALHQDNEESYSNDGFDAALIRVAPQSGTIVYAGARIGLFVVPRDDEPIQRINGSKSALGYKGVEPHQALPNTLLNIAEVKALVLATDGVFDQPGGPYCRAFGPRRWMESIQSLRHCSPESMASALRDEIDQWRGQETQRDDYSVLTIGFQ
ncbi:MAG: SpoIIE family protein phosphatase [Verrucomicrobiota bacterium]